MVTDVRDPRNPKPVNFLPMHPNSGRMHLQAADDLLLCIQEADQRALLSQQEYYGGSGKVDSSRFGKRGEDYAAGMRVYDISDPANPRHIGFMEVPGLGLHRIWYVGGRYAYASALLDGFTDHILMVIDMADPTKPQEVGRWWIPGMHAAAGETPTWTKRYALHHAIVADDFAYGSWRDGGLTILDVKDKTAPKLIAHRNWCPPFGGGTHNAVPLHDRDLLVVADEATLNIDQEGQHEAHLDVRHPREEQPDQHRHDADAVGPGLHRRWAASSVRIICTRTGQDRSRASTTIFATWQSAGVRVFDISNPFRPEEIGYFVPPQPTQVGGADARAREDPAHRRHLRVAGRPDLRHRLRRGPVHSAMERQLTRGL